MTKIRESSLVKELKPQICEGKNVVGDYIELGYIKLAIDALSQLLKPFAAIPARIVVGYAIHRIEKNWMITKKYEELLDEEFRTLDYIIKPEFLRGYKFTYGALKKGGLGYYDMLGTITNFSGTLYDIFAYLYGEGGKEMVEKIRKIVKDFVPIPGDEKLPIDIKEILSPIESVIRIPFKEFIEQLQFEYKKLEHLFIRKTAELCRFVSTQKEIGERVKKELGVGGWIPHPVMREILLTRNPPITFMLAQDHELTYEGEKIILKAKQPLNKDHVELIAKTGESLPWGIASVNEKGEFKDWLVKPQKYDKKVTFIEKEGNRIEEEATPYKTAGILWIYDIEKGMFVGGDKAPGSSVAAPLNPYFVELILKNENNKHKFREIGKETSFVAALEVIFKERDKQTINWTEGYDYPIFFPKEEQRQKFQKYFIGVHRLDHIEKIIVKDVKPL